MRTLVLVSIAFGLTACQPEQVNRAAQQQHFVCKSLIEGFLKAEGLGEYQLAHIEPTLHQTASVRHYRYHVSNDERIKLNVLAQKDLDFQCNQTAAQHFEIQLLNRQRLNSQTLLSLTLPPQKTIDTWTTFALKTQ